MTDPRIPLTVMQGDTEWRRLIDRFTQTNGVSGDARDDHATATDLTLRRAAAHKQMMTALRRLDEGSAA